MEDRTRSGFFILINNDLTDSNRPFIVFIGVFQELTEETIVYDMLLNVTALSALVFLICYTAEMLAPHDQVRHWQAQALMGFSGIIGSAWPVIHLMGLTDVSAVRLLMASLATAFLVLVAGERLIFASKLRKGRPITNE